MAQEEITFLENEFERLKKLLLPFQLEALSSILDSDKAVLQMKTGTGKTLLYLLWSIHKLLYDTRIKKIIITAPIKALSNQRFRELYLYNYNVGIETGDVIYNAENCTFLCCTQEIATQKYNSDEYIIVVDEFHFLYHNIERARAYIDFLSKTTSNYLLLCSATAGNIDKLSDYLFKVNHDNFYIYSSEKRLTEVIFQDNISKNSIENAFIVNFSSERCKRIAEELRKIRKNSGKNYYDSERIKKISQCITKYHITNTDIMNNALYGVAYYTGKTLYKEQSFVVELFTNGIIDSIVGTDALAMGVNFPIKNIVFTSFMKLGDYISSDLFWQLVGRTGRYGLYNTGYIFICDEFYCEADLKETYDNYIKNISDNFEVTILPNIGFVLRGEHTLEEEIEYAAKFSTIQIDKGEMVAMLNKDMSYIKNFDIFSSMKQSILLKKTSPKYSKEVYGNIKEKRVRKYQNFLSNFSDAQKYQELFNYYICKVYDSEFSVFENCIILRDIIFKQDPKDIVIHLCGYKIRTHMHFILQLRKYLRKLPNELYELIDAPKLDDLINEIDDTIFNVRLPFYDLDRFAEYDMNSLGIRENTKEETVQNDKKDSQCGMDTTKIKPSNSVTKGALSPKKNIINSKNASSKTINRRPKKIVNSTVKSEFPIGSIVCRESEKNKKHYIVLLHNKKSIIILDYSIFYSNSIMVWEETDMQDYVVKGKIKDTTYVDILKTCKFRLSSISVKKGDASRVRLALQKNAFLK